MPANDHNRDIVAEINKKYFGSAKDEVNIMADLGNCTKRLIIVLTLEKILELAVTGYDPDHKKEETFTDSKGKKSHQTIYSYIDKYNYVTLKDIHSMLMDALVISLRTLFYCNKQSSTAGSFVMEIVNLPNLRKLNETHLFNIRSGYGYFDVGFVTKKNIRDGSIRLKRYTVNLQRMSSKKSFMLTHKSDNYFVFYDKDSQKAQELAKLFYNSNYNNGNKINNLPDIKEYEKFYFHKDQWPDGKRYHITTTIEEVHGWKINHNKYENLCKTNFDNIVARLEELSEIMNLYYRSCISGYFNNKMNINCSVFCSLPKMVLDICESFNVKCSNDLHNEVAMAIRKRIPKTIGVMLLT